MRSRDGRRVRAALAVVSLYGLLLSTFLGALASTPPLAAAGILCQESGDRPADPQAPAHRPDCCTLGCAASAAGAPADATASLPAPPIQALRHEIAHRATPAPHPPLRLPPPRGPPAA